MKFFKTLLVFFAMLLSLQMDAQTKYYITSNSGGGIEPWGSSSNVDAMNTVFGMGGWTHDYFESCVPASVFSATTCFVYLEGGDFMALELEMFFNANKNLIQSWVANGGHLFMNSAPNEGDGMNYGFGGVILTYWGGSNDVQAAMPAHPIFNGPYLPVGTTWSGTSFSHASVSGGNVVALITDLFDASLVPLAELSWGSGTAMFGGITTNNFHSPITEAQSLTANILSYLACGDANCTALTPGGLYSDNITTTSAKLHWTGIIGTDKYAVNVYTAAGTLVAKKKTSNTYVNIPGLSPGTTYLFRVRAMCNEGGSSPFSPGSYFTTLLKEAAMESSTPITVFPNPSDGNFQISLNGMENEEATIQVMNIAGEVIFTDHIQVMQDHMNYTIALGNVPAGMYHVALISANNLSTETIIIQ